MKNMPIRGTRRMAKVISRIISPLFFEIAALSKSVPVVPASRPLVDP